MYVLLLSSCYHYYLITTSITMMTILTEPPLSTLSNHALTTLTLLPDSLNIPYIHCHHRYGEPVPPENYAPLGAAGMAAVERCAPHSLLLSLLLSHCTLITLSSLLLLPLLPYYCGCDDDDDTDRTTSLCSLYSYTPHSTLSHSLTIHYYHHLSLLGVWR